MNDFEVIIKDKDGKEIDTSIKTLDLNSNEIKVISFVCNDWEMGARIADFIRFKFEKMGLKNFLIMPIQDKDYEISIKTLKIDD